jgi:hypothetical protein
VGLQITFRFVCRAHCWIANEPSRVDDRGLGHEGAMITSSDGGVVPWHCGGSDAVITSVGNPDESRKNAGNTPTESHYLLLFRVVCTTSVAMKFSSVVSENCVFLGFPIFRRRGRRSSGSGGFLGLRTPPTLPPYAKVRVIGSSSVQFID